MGDVGLSRPAPILYLRAPVKQTTMPDEQIPSFRQENFRPHVHSVNLPGQIGDEIRWRADATAFLD